MIIYKATCSIEGKSYIGQTVRDLKSRKAEHLRAAANLSIKLRPTLLQKAISKHGSGSFIWEILEECESLGAMNDREKFYIRLHNTLAPTGYNQTTGGAMDETMSIEIRDRISKSMSKRHQDTEYKNNLYPKLKGRVPPNKGVPMSEEQKAKVGAAVKAAYDVPGYVNPNIGQKRSGQALDNLHESYKTRKLPTGDSWQEAHKDQYTDEVRFKMRAAKLNKKPANTKRVQCIETGEIYHGLSDAALGTGVNRQSIYLQIKGKLRAAGGLHFRYLD